MLLVIWSNEEALPTGPFTILEPHDQEIGDLYVVLERRLTYFEAKKM